jgi:ABC-type polysaccharide/polyol phosphate export permease
MPIGAFPDAMENISKAVPLTYCVDFMRNTFTGTVPFADNAVNIAVLAGITLVCCLLSWVFFRWE